MKQKGKCKERTLAGTDVKIREQQQHPQFKSQGTGHSFFNRWGGGGGGWWDLRGAMPKNMALKGEPDKKMLGLKGGHQRNSFKFCSDSICDNANNLPECQFLKVLIVKRPFATLAI